jgi:dolichyl-phosphate beta-glucosyltransferase
LANDKPFLSIVIPAYNEETRLPGSLQAIVDYAAQKTYPVEVLIVNNNSRDRTGEIIEEYAGKYPFVRGMVEPTQGKGAAVVPAPDGACLQHDCAAVRHTRPARYAVWL